MLRFIRPSLGLTSLALGLTSLALGLTACGGGGGDDGDAALSSKQGVAHELAVLGTLFISSADAESEGIATSKSGLPPSGDSRRKGWSHGALAPSAMGTSKSGLKAAQIAQCSDGGTSIHDSGTKSVRYGFYGNVSANSSYHQRIDTHCVSYNDSETLTEDGFSEVGDSVNSVAGYYYGYDQTGQGSTPRTYRYIEQSGNRTITDFTVRTLGLIEYRNATSGGFNSYKQLGSFQAEGIWDGEEVSQFIGYGRGDTPITYTETAAGESVDGDYAYTTEACEGGERTVETLAPIAFGSTYSTPVSGQIRLTSGAESVTVSFQPNGDATLQFGNGNSAMLTRSEIENTDLDDC